MATDATETAIDPRDDSRSETRWPDWLPGAAVGLLVGGLIGLAALMADASPKPSAPKAVTETRLAPPTPGELAEYERRLQAVDARLSAAGEPPIRTAASDASSSSVRLTQAIAEPSEPLSARDRLLDALIKAELPGATPQERAIWRESLAGLSLHDARGVLQMRSRIGAGSLVADSPSPWSLVDSSSLADSSPLTERTAPAELQPTPPSSRSRTQAAWEQAADAAERNLDRQDCFGYLAEWVLLAESEDGESIVVLERRLHEEPGPAIFTGRPLDVAVEAPSFLQVIRGEQIELTRYGRLAIEDGRLGVTLPSGFAPLHPPVAIETEDPTLRLDPQRHTTLITGPDDAIADVADLPLWTVADIGALERSGSAVYRPTGRSGEPTAVADGRVRAKYLTGSNVRAEIESDWLAELRTRIGGIRTATRPSAIR